MASPLTEIQDEMWNEFYMTLDQFQFVLTNKTQSMIWTNDLIPSQVWPGMRLVQKDIPRQPLKDSYQPQTQSCSYRLGTTPECPDWLYYHPQWCLADASPYMDINKYQQVLLSLYYQRHNKQNSFSYLERLYKSDLLLQSDTCLMTFILLICNISNLHKLFTIN